MTKTPTSAIYLILCDFGKYGLGWAERDFAHTTRERTLQDMIEGQVKNVVQVLECIPGQACNDVTAQMLHEMALGTIEAAENNSEERAAWVWDHARDLRKHEVV